MNKIISFIIPSYNVEKYLEVCLESFVIPEYMDQIEVIVVDDGSKDHTADIAMEYVEKYPETYRLISKENGGHGSTINVGSKEAKGKYFKVIDADDWVVTENLPEFLKYLSESDADVVLTPFHMVDMQTKERTVQKMYIDDYTRSYTPDEVAADWKSFDRCTTFHGITYNTAFYNQYRHELPEKVFYEDQAYATIPFCHAKKVAVLELMIYQYLIGNSEQSVARSNQIKRIGHLEMVSDYMLAYWDEHHTENTFSALYFMKKLDSIILSHYVIMCIANPEKKEGRRHCKRIREKLKETCPAVYQMVRKKCIAYTIFSMLNIGEDTYERLIHSSVFRMVRHNHKIEKE